MKLLTVLVLLVLTSSCSRLDIALNYAPRYMANQIDENFDLSSERYENLKSRMETDIQNNKKLIVDEVVKALDEVSLLANKNREVTAADIQQLNSKMRELQRQGVYLFKPSFSELILQIKETEIKKLTELSEERFKKAEKRLADRDEYMAKSMKGFERAMDFMFDAASAEQKKVYRQFVEGNMDYFQLHLQHRKNHISKYTELQANRPQLLQYSLAFYAGEEIAKSEAFKVRQQKYFADLTQLQLEIWKLCSPEQVAEFVSNIENLKNDLRKWAATKS